MHCSGLAEVHQSAGMMAAYMGRPRRGVIAHGGMAARGITADEAFTVLVEQSQQDNTKGVGTVREREE